MKKMIYMLKRAPDELTLRMMEAHSREHQVMAVLRTEAAIPSGQRLPPDVIVIVPKTQAKNPLEIDYKELLELIFEAESIICA